MEGDSDSSLEHIELIPGGVDTLAATGSVAIPNYLLKYCSHSLSKSLAVVFTKFKQIEIFTSRWKVARTKPIFKDEAKDSFPNYRPVALLTCVSKITKDAFLIDSSSL